MDPGFKNVYRVATNYVWAVLSITSVQVAVGYLFVSDLQTFTKLELLLIIGFAFANAIVQVGVYVVFRENRRWRSIPVYLHDINHLYRDVLSSLFFRSASQLSGDELIDVEQQILDKVSSRISALFQVLVGKDCQTTVYLIKDKDCFIWAASEQHVERRSFMGRRFPISNETRFQRILDRIKDKQNPIYYAGDIAKEPHYHDSLPHAERFYRSVISVPIKCTVVIPNGELESCIIGFLTVDCKSRHRLDGGFHSQYVAAFADQMFNFISIMRKHFRLDETPAAGAEEEVDLEGNPQLTEARPSL